MADFCGPLVYATYLACLAGQPDPWTVTGKDWEELPPAVRDACDRIGAAVAAQAGDVIAQVARLAEAWRMQGGLLDAAHVAGVLLETCRPWMGEGRRSDEGEAASPVAAELAPPAIDGQIALLPGMEPG